MLSKVMDELQSAAAMLVIWTATVVENNDGVDDGGGDGCGGKDGNGGDVYTWGQCPSGMGGVAGVVHSPEN